MDRRDELLRQYHRFLWRAALRASATSLGRLSGTVDDWYQEAAIALLEADERFDRSRGVKFITFAHRWVQCRLMTIARKRGGVIRVPTVVTAKYTGQADAAFAVQSLHYGGEDGMDLPAPEAISPPISPEDLARLFAVLDRRSAKIIRLRCGFEGPALTLAEVGEKLGISKERVRQIERRALDRMEVVPISL